MKPVRKRNIWIKIGRITAKVLLYTILFLLLIVLSLHFPFVQRLLREKAVVYLQKKLDTKVSIGGVYIDLPKKIVLTDVYIEDRQKDTLLAGEKIKADLGLWDLVYRGRLDINSIGLENITAKISRKARDSAFNYQFIVDAFVPTGTSDTPGDTASSAISFGKVNLDKIRLFYTDVVTGDNITASLDHLETTIDVFDPEKMNFDIGKTTVNGMRAAVYQSKPLASPEPFIKDSLEAAQLPAILLKLARTDLQDVHIDYRNYVAALFTTIDIGTLHLEPDEVNVNDQIMSISNFTLRNTSANLRLGPKEQAKVVIKEVVQEAKSLMAVGWTIRFGSVELENNNIQFEDDNISPVAEGFDFAHLDLRSVSLKAKDLFLNNDTTSGTISKASFKEKKGFVLEELTTSFLYTAEQASLDELYVKTPGTELRRKIAIRYASPEALISDLGNIQVDLDLQDSKLLVKDLLAFAPQLKQMPAFAYPNTTWLLDSRITGRIRDLQIEKLNISGLRNTRVNIAGSVTGLPDMNKLQANLAIHTIASSKQDVQLFIPPSFWPNDITLPGSFNLNGRLNSNDGRLNGDLRLNTTLGNAAIKGSVSQIADAANATYDVHIRTTNAQIGTIIRNKEFSGPVSASITAKGTGYDVKTAKAQLDGIVHSAIIHQYNYRNLDIHAVITNGHAFMKTSLVDPNIHFALNGEADLNNKFPAVKVSGMIDSIKLNPLHLTSEAMIFRGKIDADLPVTDPDNLQGNIFLTQALFVQNDQRLKMDTVQLTAGRSDSGRYINLTSDIMTARLQGNYQLTQLGDVFQQAIQPYFAIASSGSVAPLAPYDFSLNAYISDNPALKVFVPGLRRMDSVSLRSQFSNNGWTASLNAPSVDMDAGNLHGLRIDANGNGQTMSLNATLVQLESGNAVQLDNTSVVASLANNTINFVVNSKDLKGRSKYNLKGVVQQPQPERYAFSLSTDSLLLNYEPWSLSGNNSIVITSDGIQANNFILSRSGQQLSINSISPSARSPLQVDFTNFQLATLTGFIQTDSSFARGMINGKLVLTDISKPLFTSDLTINDLTLKGDTVGNIHAVVDNKISGTYNTDITLTGHGNDVKLTGNYYATGNNNFDFSLAINTLSVSTLQAFSNGKLRNGSGSMNGRFTVRGNFQHPLINGDIAFNKAGFNFSMLNSYFSIDKEKLVIDEQGIHFDRFQIKDSAQNPLTIDGLAATSNFMNYTFDLSVRANNFRALNSTKKDNRLFYGQLYFNTNLKIKGTEAAPVVDGRIVVNEKTKMTVVLPQTEPGVVDREGIIEFVDRDARLNDSLFLATYDSLNRSSFTGMDITVNIEVVPEAELNLIIDEGNGDFLNVKGEAALTAGIDPSGKVTLVGSYELEQGSYELTFNFLRRKFNIEKGSRIVWEGEPTSATLDIKAIYVANASPLDLVKNQLGDVTAFERNTYLQKLPFDVHLDMQGNLLLPEITFDIILPENKNYAVAGEIITNVRTRLEQLRQETGEMNKQVFSLLLLNRFIAENPFNSSTGGPQAGALVRQSVSKLLTEQLNRLAGDLVAGVNLNFDVTSSEDYTTGQRRDRTDLNVGLSKQLLNDRLTVSIGSNFELEGPQNTGQQTSNIAGNIALDYQISNDNRYLLRAYRKNEYQGVIEGYVIETGVGFIITVDYNRLREIFVSAKQRQQRRLQRQKQREINEVQKVQPPVTDSLPPSQ